MVFIPYSVHEALADPKWKEAMNDEMKYMKRMKYGN